MSEYYDMQKAAEVLGIGPAEVNQLREQNKLRGYRDGSSWKFKQEDVEAALAEQIKSRGSSSATADGPASDILLSEVELGESDPGASGTVISPGGDSHLGDSDLNLAGSDLNLTDDLDLTLDEDLTLEDSQISGQDDLGIAGSALDDDDLVLGDSGTGSDITIGGDSGISLVDPADSGLSLDDPLDMGDDSLELSEDDMLTLSEDTDTESPTELKTDDEFLLTPLDDGGDEDSESGSQVIALDADLGGDAGGGGLGAPLGDDMDLGDALGVGGAGASPAMGGAGFGAPANGLAPSGAGETTLPEAPYSILSVAMMALSLIVLIFTGMMLYDLSRNMWSWDGTYALNSSLMDSIVDMFNL